MIPTLYDKFKHWSQNGTVYIISDTHFDDDDCSLMDKNWISPEEQVKIINKNVSKKDTLILLGDIGNIKYIRQIKSEYKVLIKGNHDTGSSLYKDYFNEVYEGPLFIAEKILLSHEPIYGLDFCFNIHGHDHNPGHTGDETHLNVAANNCNYTPINLGRFIKEGHLKPIKSLHRKTIEQAKKNPLHKKEKNNQNTWNLFKAKMTISIVPAVLVLFIAWFVWLLFVKL